jgi:NTE family protein
MSLNKSKMEKTRPTIGLVLSGGAARGLAHLGVISVLVEHKIPVDFMVTASYGSIVGAYWSYGYSISEMLSMAKKFRLVTLLDLRKPLLHILSSDKTFSIFKKDLGDTQIEDLKIPLSILAIDFEDGSLISFEKGSLADALCASSAAPGLFTPYSYNNKLYIDGGLFRNAFSEKARKMGADVIIMSDVDIISIYSKNRFIKKVYDKLWVRVLNKREKKGTDIDRITLRNILYKTICIAQDYQNTQNGVSDFTPEFTIKPLKREIKLLRFKKVDEGFELGREAALKIIGEIKKRIFFDE